MYFTVTSTITNNFQTSITLTVFNTLAYYRQFFEVAKERYLKGDHHRETHGSIAKYFSGEYHEKYGNERVIPAQPHAYSSVALNLRKLDRLPVALLEARNFDGLRSTLGDLKFVQAKCMAGMGYELLAEATKAVGCAVSENADPGVFKISCMKCVFLLLRKAHFISRSAFFIIIIIIIIIIFIVLFYFFSS